MESKPKKWYKRKEVWGAALTMVSGGLELFAPPHTVAYKIGVFVGIGLSAFGVSKGYKAKNLPSGLTKTIDKALLKKNGY